MTCIVGIKKDGNVWIGGDRMASSDLSKDYIKEKKIFNKDDFVFGVCGSARMSQILRYTFEIPKNPKNLNSMDFLMNLFIPSLIKCFEKNSYDGAENVKIIKGGTFLFGYKKNLYKICENFQIEEIDENYMSCGSGEFFALGSLYTTKNLNMTPDERIIVAIKGASHHCPSVGGKIDILKI